MLEDFRLNCMLAAFGSPVVQKIVDVDQLEKQQAAAAAAVTRDESPMQVKQGEMHPAGTVETQPVLLSSSIQPREQLAQEQPDQPQPSLLPEPRPEVAAGRQDASNGKASRHLQPVSSQAQLQQPLPSK